MPAASSARPECALALGHAAGSPASSIGRNLHRRPGPRLPREFARVGSRGHGSVELAGAGSLSIRGGTADIDIVAGRIVSDHAGSRQVLDASGCTRGPRLRRRADQRRLRHRSHGRTRARATSSRRSCRRPGVTAFAPTIVTAPPEVTARAVDVIGRRSADAGPRPGRHARSAFTSRGRSSTRRARVRTPSATCGSRRWPRRRAGTRRAVSRWSRSLRSCPARSTWSVGSSRSGVVVCVGHTAATPAELDAAFAAGVTARRTSTTRWARSAAVSRARSARCSPTAP